MSVRLIFQYPSDKDGNLRLYLQHKHKNETFKKSLGIKINPSEISLKERRVNIKGQPLKSAQLNKQIRGEYDALCQVTDTLLLQGKEPTKENIKKLMKVEIINQSGINVLIDEYCSQFKKESTKNNYRTALVPLTKYMKHKGNMLHIHQLDGKWFKEYFDLVYTGILCNKQSISPNIINRIRYYISENEIPGDKNLVDVVDDYNTENAFPRGFNKLGEKLRRVESELEMILKVRHLDDINEYWMDSRVTFPPSENTTKQYVRRLALFVKWAYQNEYTSNMDWMKWNDYAAKNLNRIETKEKPYLEDREVGDILSLDKTELTNIEILVRDMILFLRFTGLRNSDFIKVRFKDIVNNILVIKTQKASKNLEVYLNPVVMNLVERYRKKSLSPNDTIFPRISSEDFNNTLRLLAKKANINRPYKQIEYKGGELVEVTGPLYKFLSHHCLRHTMATQMIANGATITDLLDTMGWSNINTAMNYVHKHSATILEKQKELLKVSDTILNSLQDV